MTAISPIKATIESAGRTAKRPARPPQAGDRLMAKVVGIEKDGMVRLDLGQFTATAAMRAQVTVGMLLPVDVLETSGQLIVRIRERKRRTAPKSAQRPVTGTSGGETNKARRQLFRSLRQLRGITRWTALQSAGNKVPYLLRLLAPLNPLTDSGASIAAQIQERIENSGLFFESRLDKHLAASETSPDRTRSAPLGPGAETLPAMLAQDTKAIMLQLLADLRKATKPLPPLLATMEKNAAILLSDIQAQQCQAIEQRFPEAAQTDKLLVYSARSGAVGSSARATILPQKVLEAWWRITGDVPPPALEDAVRRDPSKRLLAAVQQRRDILKTAEAVSRSLSLTVQQSAPEMAAAQQRRNPLTTTQTASQSLVRTDQQTAPEPEKQIIEADQLIRAMRTYIRIPEAHTGIRMPPAWRRLQRLASALAARRSTPSSTDRQPNRQQRLSAALNRLIRDEIERFDADLGALKRMHSEPFAGDVVQQGPRQRTGDAPGETGQVFGFTLPMANSDSPARLHVYCPPRKQTNTPGSHQVAILLSLRPMGDVRAEISLSPEGLQVTLGLTEEDALQWVSKHQKALESALASLAQTVRVNTHRHSPGSSTAVEAPPWVRATGNTRVSVHV